MTAARTALPDSVERVIAEMRAADEAVPLDLNWWADRLQSLRPAGEVRPYGYVTETAFYKPSEVAASGFNEAQIAAGRLVPVYTRPAGSPSSAAHGAEEDGWVTVEKSVTPEAAIRAGVSALKLSCRLNCDYETTACMVYTEMLLAASKEGGE